MNGLRVSYFQWELVENETSFAELPIDGLGFFRRQSIDTQTRYFQRWEVSINRGAARLHEREARKHCEWVCSSEGCIPPNEANRDAKV